MMLTVVINLVIGITDSSTALLNYMLALSWHYLTTVTVSLSFQIHYGAAPITGQYFVLLSNRT
jgi:hypothetical protein